MASSAAASWRESGLRGEAAHVAGLRRVLDPARTSHRIEAGGASSRRRPPHAGTARISTSIPRSSTPPPVGRSSYLRANTERQRCATSSMHASQPCPRMATIARWNTLHRLASPPRGRARRGVRLDASDPGPRCTDGVCAASSPRVRSLAMPGEEVRVGWPAGQGGFAVEDQSPSHDVQVPAFEHRCGAGPRPGSRAVRGGRRLRGSLLGRGGRCLARVGTAAPSALALAAGVARGMWSGGALVRCLVLELDESEPVIHVNALESEAIADGRVDDGPPMPSGSAARLLPGLPDAFIGDTVSGNGWPTPSCRMEGWSGPYRDYSVHGSVITANSGAVPLLIHERDG